MESAKDRNITFRMQGTGCLNINDINIFKIIEGAGEHPTSSATGNINRIIDAEIAIGDLRARATALTNRVYRLEQG